MTRASRRDVRGLFARFDQQYFGGRLSREGWRLVWDESLSVDRFPGGTAGLDAAGMCLFSERVISLSSGLLEHPDGVALSEGEDEGRVGELEAVLLHEMVHAVTCADHDWRFWKESDRLRALGASVDPTDVGPLSPEEEREEDDEILRAAGLLPPSRLRDAGSGGSCRHRS